MKLTKENLEKGVIIKMSGKTIKAESGAKLRRRRNHSDIAFLSWKDGTFEIISKHFPFSNNYIVLKNGNRCSGTRQQAETLLELLAFSLGKKVVAIEDKDIVDQSVIIKKEK